MNAQGLKPGVLQRDCGAPPPGGYPDPQGIKKVYIVFSNHLDIGYTDNVNGSCAGSVVNRYFHDHFPNAIKTANAFRAKAATNKNREYKWMSQSWLASVYRNCEATKVNIHGPSAPTDIICPNASALAAFQQAVEQGDIGWHAFPHNAEPETMSATMFDIALNITFRQDALAKHAQRMTLSQRDVPGMTRAVIPLLRKRGVKAISVGENGACAPVNVPKSFIWRDPPSGESILALFHPHGYGRRRRRRRRRRRLLETDGSTYEQTSAEETEDVEDDDPTGGPSITVGPDGKVLPIDRENHCATVPFSGVAVCYAWNSDNKGPHTYVSANAIFDAVEESFPQATVHASDAFDDFVTDVQPFLHYLPVVEKEIGDTWIYGASTDPLKVSKARACYRAREACAKAGKCSEADEPNIRAFDRLLIKVSEHTWGWNGGSIRTPVKCDKHGKCTGSYDNVHLNSAIKTEKDYYTAVDTWHEQRAFIENAIAALGSTSALGKAIAAEFTALEPTPFPTAGFEEITDLTTVFKVDGSLNIGFGGSGAITTLGATSGAGRQWADATHSLGEVWYQGISNETMVGFTNAYNVKHAGNFEKPDLDLKALNAIAKLTRLRVKKSTTMKTEKVNAGETLEFLLDLTFDPVVHATRGAPENATAHIVVTHSAYEAAMRRRRRRRLVGASFAVGATAAARASAVQELLLTTAATSTTIEYTLQMRNKTACHAPESMWFSSNPLATTSGEWSADMMGSQIGASEANLTGQDANNPHNCVGGRYEATTGVTCGVHLHAVGENGVTYSESEGTAAGGGGVLTLSSKDVMLVSLGVALPVPTPLLAPDMSQGVHFSLVNNIWNTVSVLLLLL